MNNTENTKKNGSYKRAILTTVLTLIASIVLYTLLYNFIIMILYMDVREEDRNWTDLSYAIIVIYALVFHFVYARRHINSSGIGITGGGFDIKEAVTEFYHADGKAFLMVYGVLAVVFEVSFIIAVSTGTPNNVFALLIYLFPAANFIRIPVIRSIFGYAVLVASVFAVVAFRRYKIQKYWEKGN